MSGKGEKTESTPLLQETQHAGEEKGSGGWNTFDGLLGSVIVTIFLLYWKFVSYPTTFTTEQDIQYIFYLDVTIMMLVGFGFLMTFQRLNMLSAVGFTFLITILAILVCVLTGRFFASLAGNLGEYTEITPGNFWVPIALDTNALLQGDFAAAAVLISFGGLIGKISPSQILLLVLVEVPLYSFNKEYLCIGKAQTLDMGGTIFIHLFGAYFGLSAAWVLGVPTADQKKASHPSKISDIFSLIGTIFLWIYWPSFNGATALFIGNQQTLTTVNTVISLCGSCLVVFLLSVRWGIAKIKVADIQNATLAGGVAIGAVSNLEVSPAIAFAVGITAGAVSTWGFRSLQENLEENFHLHDSCGIHNLHGMPALVGSLVVVIATGIASCQGEVEFPRGAAQPLAQAEGAIITLVVAVCGGLTYGKLATLLRNKHGHASAIVSPPFEDEPFWEVATAS